MKKLIAMGLTVIMTAVAVCGCGSSDSGNDAKKSDNQTKQQAVKVIDVDLTSEEYAFGVDKNKPELLTQVNDFIKEIKDNGTFDEICNKYFGGGNPTPVKSEKLDTSKDQLLVATNASFEPFEYMKGDSYYGIDMEIAAAQAIASLVTDDELSADYIIPSALDKTVAQVVADAVSKRA